MKSFFGSILFILGIGFGFEYVYKSWSGEKFVSLINLSDNPNREIAAVKKILDISQMEGSIFSSLSSQKLLTNSQLSKDSNDNVYLVTLGHYVMRTKEGKMFLACQMYDKVLLKYEAEGVASNGDLPKMEIMADCNLLGNDINHIAPIKIPAKEILAQTPGEGEINFKENYNIVVNFMNVSESWPKQWALKSVTLTDTKKNQFDTALDVAQVPLTISKNLNMDWTRL